jgi:hypothetical protein
MPSSKTSSPPTETPATYAPGMPLHWDSERAKIKLEQSIRDVSVNSNATLLALLVENDTYISMRLTDWAYAQVLKGSYFDCGSCGVPARES